MTHADCRPAGTDSAQARRSRSLTDLPQPAILNHMVYLPRTLDRTFGALADPTRRQIVRRLARRDETILELAGHFDMTLPGISKHVRVLERAGLVRIRRVGRSRRTTLVGRPMREAMEWINQYRALWEHQFDRLAAYLESTNTNTTAPE